MPKEGSASMAATVSGPTSTCHRPRTRRESAVATTSTSIRAGRSVLDQTTAECAVTSPLCTTWLVLSCSTSPVDRSTTTSASARAALAIMTGEWRAHPLPF